MTYCTLVVTTQSVSHSRRFRELLLLKSWKPLVFVCQRVRARVRPSVRARVCVCVCVCVCARVCVCKRSLYNFHFAITELYRLSGTRERNRNERGTFIIITIILSRSVWVHLYQFSFFVDPSLKRVRFCKGGKKTQLRSTIRKITSSTVQ